jgi:hypothetical protein
MELQITVLSEDTDYAVSEASQLKKDLDFFVPEAESTQVKKQLQPDDAAFGWLDGIVKLFLGKGFIEKVADVLKTWIEKRADVINAKKAKIQFEIKDDKGKVITIILENVKDAEKLLEQLKPYYTTF